WLARAPAVGWGADEPHLPAKSLLREDGARGRDALLPLERRRTRTPAFEDSPGLPAAPGPGRGGRAPFAAGAGAWRRAAPPGAATKHPRGSAAARPRGGSLADSEGILGPAQSRGASLASTRRPKKSKYTADRGIPGAFEGETVTRRRFMTGTVN